MHLVWKIVVCFSGGNIFFFPKPEQQGFFFPSGFTFSFKNVWSVYPNPPTCSQRKGNLQPPRERWLWWCQTVRTSWWNVRWNLEGETSSTWLWPTPTWLNISTSALLISMVKGLIKSNLSPTGRICIIYRVLSVLSLDNEFFFVDNDTKISKAAPDGWKKVPTTTFVLFFRVKFFVTDISLLL